MIDANNLPYCIKITPDRCINVILRVDDTYYQYLPVHLDWIDEHLPYKITGFDFINIDESISFPDERAAQWIIDNLTGHWYFVKAPYGHVKFELAEDAALFKLRWC